MIEVGQGLCSHFVFSFSFWLCVDFIHYVILCI